MGEGRAAYAAAGVDVEAGDRAVELMRAAVERTRRPRSWAARRFGAASRSRPGSASRSSCRRPTGSARKTAIAAALGRYDTIGRDLVRGCCADDVVCSGAAPRLSSRLRGGRIGSSRSRCPISSAAWHLAASMPAARSSAARPRAPGADAAGRVRPRGLLCRRRRARPSGSTAGTARAGRRDLRGWRRAGSTPTAISLVRAQVAEMGT